MLRLVRIGARTGQSCRNGVGDSGGRGRYGLRLQLRCSTLLQHISPVHRRAISVSHAHLQVDDKCSIDDLVQLYQTNSSSTSVNSMYDLATRINTPAARLVALSAACRAKDLDAIEKWFDEVQRLKECTDMHIQTVVRTYLDVGRISQAEQIMRQCLPFSRSLLTMTKLYSELIESAWRSHQHNLSENDTAQQNKILKRTIIQGLVVLNQISRSISFGASTDPSSAALKDAMKPSFIVLGDIIAETGLSPSNLAKAIHASTERFDNQVLSLNDARAFVLHGLCVAKSENARLGVTNEEIDKFADLIEWHNHDGGLFVRLQAACTTGSVATALELLFSASQASSSENPILLASHFNMFAKTCERANDKTHLVDMILSGIDILHNWAGKIADVANRYKTETDADDALISTVEVLKHANVRESMKLLYRTMFEADSATVPLGINALCQLAKHPQDANALADVYDEGIIGCCKHKNVVQLAQFLRDLSGANVKITVRSLRAMLQLKHQFESGTESKEEQVIDKQQSESNMIKLHESSPALVQNNSASKHFELSSTQWMSLFRGALRLASSPIPMEFQDVGDQLPSEIAMTESVSAAGERVPDFVQRQQKNASLLDYAQTSKHHSKGKNATLDELLGTEISRSIQEMNSDSGTSEQVYPDWVTDVVTMIQAAGEAADLPKAYSLHEKLQTLGFDPPTEAYEGLLWGCCHAQQPNRALETLRYMQQTGEPASSSAYEAVIEASVPTGRTRLLRDLVEESYEAELVLPKQCYIATINSLGDMFDVGSLLDVLHFATSAGYSDFPLIAQENATNLNLTEFSVGAISCMLYIHFQSLRKVASQGNSFPSTIHIQCNYATQPHIKSVLTSFDPPLEFDTNTSATKSMALQLNSSDNLETLGSLLESHKTEKHATNIVIRSEHLTSWLTRPVGKENIDDAFDHMPKHLRRLSSSASQLQGTELSKTGRVQTAFDPTQQGNDVHQEDEENDLDEGFLAWRQKWQIQRADSRIASRRRKQSQNTSHS